MAREVIEQKLEALRHCLQRVADKCPTDAKTLAQNLDLQDIISLNLTRAIQLCVDMGTHIIAGMEVSPPDTMGQTLPGDSPRSTPAFAGAGSILGFPGFGGHLR